MIPVRWMNYISVHWCCCIGFGLFNKYLYYFSLVILQQCILFEAICTCLFVWAVFLFLPICCPLKNWKCHQPPKVMVFLANWWVAFMNFEVDLLNLSNYICLRSLYLICSYIDLIVVACRICLMSSYIVFVITIMMGLIYREESKV